MRFERLEASQQSGAVRAQPRHTAARPRPPASRVLVVVGHPRRRSLSAALAEAYAAGAAEAEGARERLYNARMLRKEGDEDSCRSHLDQARRIVDNVRR